MWLPHRPECGDQASGSARAAHRRTHASEKARYASRSSVLVLGLIHSARARSYSALACVSVMAHPSFAGCSHSKAVPLRRHSDRTDSPFSRDLRHPAGRRIASTQQSCRQDRPCRQRPVCCRHKAGCRDKENLQPTGRAWLFQSSRSVAFRKAHGASFPWLVVRIFMSPAPTRRQVSDSSPSRAPSRAASVRVCPSAARLPACRQASDTS